MSLFEIPEPETNLVRHRDSWRLGTRVAELPNREILVYVQGHFDAWDPGYIEAIEPKDLDRALMNLHRADYDAYCAFLTTLLGLDGGTPR